MIFHTHDSQLSSISELPETQYRSWKSVDVPLLVNWFVVDLTVTMDGERHRLLRLVSELADLRQLKESDSTAACRLHAVYLMSPPSMNRTDRWKMEQLVAVSQLVEGGKLGAHAFEVATGARYLDSGEVLATADVELVEWLRFLEPGWRETLDRIN